MKCRIAAWFAAGLLTTGGLFSFAEAPIPQKILERADQYRAGWESFIMSIRITNFKGDRKEGESQYYEVYQRKNKSFVKFLNPREKGRSLLMLEDDLWIYMPSTSRPIRITPMQRLTGNVSNGDVARSDYARDYEAVLLREEQVEGKTCFVLELNARRRGATYPKIHYWVAKSDFSPCKADFFLTSGKNHKTVHYDSFANFQGRRLVTHMTFYDNIRKQEKSVMEYLRYTPRDIPEKYFNKDSMATNSR